ncbi:MAG TPA: hypothetical protein VI790_01610 [Candidatus Nanoarchaeia archaeon]|nr:hypothetical protein [Candidatus Nanoarchaeia archaeon]
MFKINRRLNSIIEPESVKGDFITILNELETNESLANEAYATGLEYLMPTNKLNLKQITDMGFTQSNENINTYTKILNTNPELKAIIYRQQLQIKLIIRDS